MATRNTLTLKIRMELLTFLKHAMRKYGLESLTEEDVDKLCNELVGVNDIAGTGRNGKEAKFSQSYKEHEVIERNVHPGPEKTSPINDFDNKISIVTTSPMQSFSKGTS